MPMALSPMGGPECAHTKKNRYPNADLKISLYVRV